MPFCAGGELRLDLAFSFSQRGEVALEVLAVLLRVLASAVDLLERTRANASRRSTSWPRTRETSLRRASIASATLGLARARAREVLGGLGRHLGASRSRTASMIARSCCPIRLP